MGINPYRPVETREKESDLDKVLKGLHIAHSIYGIKEAADKAALLKGQAELTAQKTNADLAAAQDARQGILTVKDLLDKGDRYDRVTAETKGATWHQLRRGDQVEDVWLKPRPQPASEGIALRIQERNDKITERNENKINTAAEKLASKLEGAAEMNAAIGSVEKKLGFNLDDYKDGDAVDLPGVSVPLLGRVTAHSNDAQKLQSSIAKIFNVELKDRSGAAVTHPELERIKEEFATGKLNTEEQMIGALRDYKTAFATLAQHIESGFDPAARDRINERGGFTSQSISRGTGEDVSQSKYGLAGKGGSALRPPTANAAPDTRGTPPPNGVATVQQNGHTYTWNPKTGKYE